MTRKQRKQRARGKKKIAKQENIAVLDMETDPFDNQLRDLRIKPFVVCIYSRDFSPIVIWEEHFETFVEKLLAELDALPKAYTIYAHAGGKFDWMFLIHRIRGQVSFKGRGIMAAKIGKHEIRDSYHIIPERLASYNKQQFDYENMRKGKRSKPAIKKQIIEYLISDCENLLKIVEAFIQEYGMKLSIGQAAMAIIREVMPDEKAPENISEGMDTLLRHFFFGGRVECIAGRGTFLPKRGDSIKLYDVNSMYPYVMAEFVHPLGRSYTIRTRGDITSETCFIKLQCRNNRAFVARCPDTGETTSRISFGTFFVSIHEYQMARKLGLISREKIFFFVDNPKSGDFKEFVHPRYAAREKLKAELKQMEKARTQKYLNPDHMLMGARPLDIEFNEQRFLDTTKDSLFLKLLLNNGYGKFAQNPRSFKESFITDPGKRPPLEAGLWGDLPAFTHDQYEIWERPAPERRYNNVGTAASITGAARATLMEAIHYAENPIYCDTDSLVCSSLHSVDFHASKLGAWDLEAEFSAFKIAGKKLYAGEYLHAKKDAYKIRAKGVSGLKFDDFDTLLNGDEVKWLSPAVTMDKRSRQYYMERTIRATAA